MAKDEYHGRKHLWVEIWTSCSIVVIAKKVHTAWRHLWEGRWFGARLGTTKKAWCICCVELCVQHEKDASCQEWLVPVIRTWVWRGNSVEKQLLDIIAVGSCLQWTAECAVCFGFKYFFLFKVRVPGNEVVFHSYCITEVYTSVKQVRIVCVCMHEREKESSVYHPCVLII